MRTHSFEPSLLRAPYLVFALYAYIVFTETLLRRRYFVAARAERQGSEGT